MKEAAHQLNRRTEFSILRNDYVPKPKPEKPGTPKIEVVTEPEENSITYTLTKDGDYQATCLVNGITMDFQYSPKAEGVLYCSAGSHAAAERRGDRQGRLSKEIPTKIILEGAIADKAVINIREMKIGNNTAENSR